MTIAIVVNWTDGKLGRLAFLHTFQYESLLFSALLLNLYWASFFPLCMNRSQTCQTRPEAASHCCEYFWEMTEYCTLSTQDYKKSTTEYLFGWRSVMTAASCCAPSTSSREQPVPSISSLPIVHDPQPDLPNQTRSSISRPRVFLGDGRNSFITFLPLCHMVIAWQYPLLPEIQILPLLFYTSHFLPGGIHRNRTIKILCKFKLLGKDLI